MEKNCDFLYAKAIHAYYTTSFKKAFSYTTHILKQDPYHRLVQELHIALMVELELKRDLFTYAHALVHNNPG
tara:strand:+ start:31 stop:246 length:216 start_codon:yes stop_codon:yes gene_type:complete